VYGVPALEVQTVDMSAPKVCPGTEALGAYLEGGGESREAVELHLSACAGCRAEAKELARLLKEVGESTVAAPPGLSARILRTAVPPSRRPWLAAAAAVLAAAGLVLAWRATRPAEPVAPPQAAAPLPAPPPAPEERIKPAARFIPEPPPPPPPAPEKRPPPAPEAPSTPVPDPVAPPAPVPPPPAPAPETTKPVVPTRTAVARVKSVEGKVVLLSGKAAAPCAMDVDILPEGGIQTSAGSAAVVVFPDGTTLELGPSTTIRRFVDLEGQDGTGKRVDMEAGAIAAQVVKQPAGRSMVFVTPQAEARVLGTALRIALVGAKGDATRLEVSEGKVRLKRLDGKSVDVAAGQFALAVPGVELASRKASSLVLHWKLDDAQGALARDASGNGNDGTVVGTPGWGAGHAGGAFDLIQAKMDSPVLDLGKEVKSFTAAFWVSQETLPGYQDSYFQFIPGVSLVREANMGSGRIRVMMKTDGVNEPLAFDSVLTRPKQWTHVALAWDGAAAILYRNGRDVARARITGRLIAPDGFFVRLGGSEKIDAKVDDLRLYRRALSEAEIREVFAGGSVR
jgi:ferric-dicitrate binding protein FerR (iron transport regulator)